MPAPNRSPLRNIGPVSAEWLAGIGVESLADLRRLGVVETFALVRRQRNGVSLNLLWALAGAAREIDWRELTDENKAVLKLQLAALSD